MAQLLSSPSSPKSTYKLSMTLSIHMYTNGSTLNKEVNVYIDDGYKISINYMIV